MKAKEKFTLNQNCIKRWFYRKSIGNTSFAMGDLLLKWDKPYEDKGKPKTFSPCGWVLSKLKNSLANTIIIYNHLTGRLTLSLLMAKM